MRTVPLSHFQRKGHMTVTDSSQLDMGEDNKTHNAKNIRSLLLEGLEYRPALRIVISSCV